MSLVRWEPFSGTDEIFNRLDAGGVWTLAAARPAGER
jgi:hypothetical protein